MTGLNETKEATGAVAIDTAEFERQLKVARFNTLSDSVYVQLDLMVDLLRDLGVMDEVSDDDDLDRVVSTTVNAFGNFQHTGHLPHPRWPKPPEPDFSDLGFSRLTD